MGWLNINGNWIGRHSGKSWSSYCKTIKICLTGDSIAHGMDEEGDNLNIAELIANTIGCQQQSIAYPAEGTVEQQVRWDALTDEEKLSFDFIININGNNIASAPSTPNATSVGLYQNFMDVIKADIKADCKIVCCTMTPAASVYEAIYEGIYTREQVVAKRTAFNNSVMGLGDEPVTGQDLLVTEHTYSLADPEYDLAEIYWGNGDDKLHPNEAGRQVIADAVISVLYKYWQKTILGTPSTLSAVAGARYGVTLSWVNGTNNFDSIEIQRSTDGVNFSVLGNALNGMESYYDSTVLIGTLYYYKIRGVKRSTYSAFSDVVNVTTADMVTYLSDDKSFAFWDAMDEASVTKDESYEVSAVEDQLGLNNFVAGSCGWSETDGLVFNGSTHYLSTGSKTLGYAKTIYLVLKQITWTQYDRITDGYTEGTLTARQDVESAKIVTNTTTGYTDPVTGTLGIYQLLRIKTTGGANSKIQINNDTAVLFTSGNTLSFVANGITLGTRGNLSGAFSNIAVKKMIVRKVADSDNDYDRIGAYLMTKL